MSLCLFQQENFSMSCNKASCRAPSWGNLQRSEPHTCLLRFENITFVSPATLQLFLMCFGASQTYCTKQPGTCRLAYLMWKLLL